MIFLQLNQIDFRKDFPTFGSAFQKEDTISSIRNFKDMASQLVQKGVQERTAVICATDESTQQSVAMATQQGWVEAVMIGCTDQAKQSQPLMACSQHLSFIEAANDQEAAEEAVAMVKEGAADIIMKGLISMDVVIRAIPDREKGTLPAGSVLTHVTAAPIPDYYKLLFSTDAAVISYPTQEQRFMQIRYITRLCHQFGITQPEVALIHCSEKVNAEHFPFTAGYASLIGQAEAGAFGPCIVDSSLDLKVSCNLHSVQAKHIDSSMQESADALVFSDIETGNLFYKTITLFVHGETACMLQGAQCPVVLPSRGDNVMSKFNSLALACLHCQRAVVPDFYRNNQFMFYILSTNPGSISTKIAVFEDEQMLFTCNIKHYVAELSQFDQPMDQLEYRWQLVTDTLKQMEVPFNFNTVIGRGGLARPVKSGVYEVNERMLELTRNALHQHACDLGCLIAYDITKAIPGCLPLIADPDVVDELSPLAKISDSPLLPRYCIWHALNQKAIVRRYVRDIGKRYEGLSLIVCHLGGGISIAAHEHGRAIDANNTLGGEGPFSPERADSLLVADLIRLCFSGKYITEQLIKNVTAKTGLQAHLSTNDVKEIPQRIDQGDQHAQLILDAMLLHTTKAIASETAVLYGKVDAILLTGGIAYSDYVANKLRERLDFLAPVITYPGKSEVQAMSNSALAVLRGGLETKEYH